MSDNDSSKIFYDGLRDQIVEIYHRIDALSFEDAAQPRGIAHSYAEVLEHVHDEVNAHLGTASQVVGTGSRGLYRKIFELHEAAEGKFLADKKASASGEPSFVKWEDFKLKRTRVLDETRQILGPKHDETVSVIRRAFEMGQ